MNSELIYVFFNEIDSLPSLKNQGFCLSNRYEIDVDFDGFGYCSAINISEKEDIYESLYSECIRNINILVGINGMGKTTLLNILGGTRNERKSKLFQWSFFFLYKIDEYFVIEGNNKALIEYIVDDFSHRNGISSEYSIKCKYDYTKKKFNFLDFCSSSDEESIINKILYYKDKCNNSIKWINVDDSYDEEIDYNVFMERKIITPNALSICNYINSIDENYNWGEFTLPELYATITLTENNGKSLFWKNYDDKFFKKTFIFKLLLDYASDNYIKLEDKKLEVIRNLAERVDRESEKKTIDYKKIDSLLSQIYKIYEIKKHKDFLEVIDTLLLLSESFFKESMSWRGEGLIAIPNGKTLQFKVSDKKFRKLLQKMDKVKGIDHTLEVIYPQMSAGELKMIDIFSSLETFINGEGQNYIVLLDEPEKSFHPEMSRRFIYNLKVHAEKLACKYKCTFQFLITTHTPFLISDIPKSYIHCIKKDKSGKISIQNAEMGLLSNVHDIMKETFFLDKPFGEFSNKYFDFIISQVNNLEKENKEKVRKIIDDIDEPTIFTYLNKIYNEKIKEISTDDELIMYYEKQLEKLKEKK